MKVEGMQASCTYVKGGVSKCGRQSSQADKLVVIPQRPRIPKALVTTYTSTHSRFQQEQFHPVLVRHSPPLRLIHRFFSAR